MKLLKGKGRFRNAYLTMRAVSAMHAMQNMFRSKSWERNIKDEFEDLHEETINDKLFEVLSAELISCMLMDSKEGIDYKRAVIFGDKLVDFMITSHDWVPDEYRTQKILDMQMEKSFFATGQMFCKAMNSTKSGIEDKIDAFTGALIKEENGTILKLFARWLHNQAEVKDVKIMSRKYSDEELHTEVALLTDFLTSREDQELNPSLTAQALSTIAESFHSLEHVSDMKNFDNEKDNSPEYMGKLIDQRLKSLDKEIEMLVRRSRNLIDDMGVKNPEAIFKSIMERTAQQMGGMVSAVKNNPDSPSDGFFDN